METTLVVVGCAVMGVVIGSFLTVVVDRVPRGASIVAPPSRLRIVRPAARRTRPGAGAELAGTAGQVPPLQGADRHRTARPRARDRRDLRAVRRSLRRRGRAARVLHPRRGAGGAQRGSTCASERLPREITYVTIVLGVVARSVSPRSSTTSHDGSGRCCSARRLALAIMGAIYLGSRGGMGDGDVRLAPLLGLYLGWLNPGIVPVGLFLGFLLGAVVGVAMMAAGKAGTQDRAAVRAVPGGRHRGRGLRRPVVRRHVLASLIDPPRPSSSPLRLRRRSARRRARRTSPTRERRRRSRRSTPTNTIMIGSNIVVNFLIRLSSSRSKYSLATSSCSSSVPVSSPTLNICRAAPGNSPVSASGWAKPPPSSICCLGDLELLAVDDVRRRLGRRLPSPSGSGTPALHHRAEDPAEALEDRVLDDALDDRDLEHQPVLERPCRVWLLNSNDITRDEHEEAARRDVPQIAEEAWRRTAASASAAAGRRRAPRTAA